jgi:hypothetical protein
MKNSYKHFVDHKGKLRGGVFSIKRFVLFNRVANYKFLKPVARDVVKVAYLVGLTDKKGEGNAEREKERGNTHLLTAAILPYFFEISECFLLFDSPGSFVPGDTLSLEPRALAAVVLG